MYQDVKDLLSAFHAQNVKYPIAGGYAALLAFGAPLQDFTVGNLSDPRQFIRLGRESMGLNSTPRGNGGWKDSPTSRTSRKRRKSMGL